MPAASSRTLASQVLRAAAALAGAALLAACSPIGLAINAAGIATDTSMTWEVVKHVHAKLTEDDPTPCAMLDSVNRALNPRCDYVPGSIRTADLKKAGLQTCALTVAARDPRLWRALPELLQRGARVEDCPRSPLVALAEVDACPDFASATPEAIGALRELALADPRAVRHDVFRLYSCPAARRAGLDAVLVAWLDRGDLEPGRLSFSPLSALSPEMLVTRFGRELEVAGHRPEAALDGYDGVQPPGFEVALRQGDWAALEWWLYRLPRLARGVPPSRGGQLAWLPLQRVLVPGYLRFPEQQRDMVVFLMARGADPRQRLPFDRDRTVLAWARQAKSPLLGVLDPPSPPRAEPLRQAANELPTPR